MGLFVIVFGIWWLSSLALPSGRGAGTDSTCFIWTKTTYLIGLDGTLYIEHSIATFHDTLL